MEANGKSEIRKGLEAGQKVVVSGQFLIDSEASLKTTVERMQDGPATPGETGGQTHGTPAGTDHPMGGDATGMKK